MCGINGIFARNKVDRLQERISKMNICLQHRGPDASEDVVVNERVSFGHLRLSIIDLDPRSNQPIKSHSERYTLVYNGEILNFKEIKKELEYDFHTESDTEVILAALECESIDWLLKRANGMFAFAVFDSELNELTLVRDRFGIKPLFYSIVDGQFIFSSEIKGILNSGLVDAKFNSDAIDEYLGNRYVREPFTFFENIYQLKGATILKVDNDLNVSEKSYWSLPRMNFSKDYNEKQIIEETKLRVKAAIERWLISDVKVGAYLSGGVDSSLTTAIIAERSDAVDTYTIGFEDEGFNEFEYARLVAEKYETDHREFILNADNYIKEWERLIWFKDGPLGVPNEIPLAIMSTNLSNDITVVISGEGADELFGGYGRIFRLPFDYANDKSENSFYSEFIGQYEYVSRPIRDKYLVTGNLRDHFDKELQTEFESHSNEESIFRFFHRYHVKGLLQRVDMTTMQTSVEARPPFMDHELIEYVYEHVPYDLKLRWKSEESRQKAKKLKASHYSEVLDSPKYVLKEAARNYLPDEIIDRKKVGFPVPLSNWFPNLIEQARTLLSGANWLKKQELDNLINEVQKEPRAGQLLWMFLNVEMFRKRYFEVDWRW